MLLHRSRPSARQQSRTTRPWWSTAGPRWPPSQEALLAFLACPLSLDLLSMAFLLSLSGCLYSGRSDFNTTTSVGYHCFPIGWWLLEEILWFKTGSAHQRVLWPDVHLPPLLDLPLWHGPCLLTNPPSVITPCVRRSLR